ncbi:hypothetical protein BN14_11872 [Rhizoctonia solani AG-1 IB]|uniref:Amine oxidase domain-containing protein n=1 Tax=Thanatephorus cucumeris (strain AG1-IB / isolate 7/3/14) TaxID=1108050 RepID=M5CCP9_THACB|nr:hypothetical protein BN14_11872 [Rhizoctonia solani AG-1 IB]
MSQDPKLGLYKTDNNDTTNVFWKYSQHIIQEYQNQLKINLPIPPSEGDGKNKVNQPVKRVAVIGGGVLGLRVAMKLGAKYKVDLFEASDRVGGRLYTHNFENGGEWDYFDVGAMRFPHTSVMRTTYQLFQELEIPLIRYRMETPESFLYYNGVCVQRNAAQGQDFNACQSQRGNIPDDWVDKGYKNLLKNVFDRWLFSLRRDFENTIMGEEIFPKKDLYPTTVINWLETMAFSVGWFDQSFVETVLEMYVFAEGLPDTRWRCVKHGSQRITDAMKNRIETNKTFKKNINIHLFRQVTSVVCDEDLGELTVSGEHRPVTGIKLKPTEIETFEEKGYSHVVLAVSPQVMRYIDLSTCQLDYSQRSALLTLSPGPSTKVGIKFKTNWWKERFGINGGQSQTDRPVRTVVYPSHGNGESTVLIASYCWTQDAATMGSLMQGDESFDNIRLQKAILSDLVEVHGIELGFLEGQFESMFPFDWAHNPLTMGAFAFFGPGQFSTLYANLTRCSANGRLHFAGEAISTCHA